jgi:hypothetical protein
LLAVISDPDSARGALDEIREASDILEARKIEVNRMQIDAKEALKAAHEVREETIRIRGETEALLLNRAAELDSRQLEVTMEERRIAEERTKVADAWLIIKNQQTALTATQAAVERDRSELSGLLVKAKQDTIAAAEARAKAETDANATATARNDAEARLARMRQAAA